jgi:hypothetical protein
LASDIGANSAQIAQLQAAADAVRTKADSDPNGTIDMSPITAATKDIMDSKKDLHSTVTASSTPGVNLVTYRTADGVFAYAAYEKDDKTHTVNVPDKSSSTGVSQQTVDSQGRPVNEPLVKNVIDTSYMVTPADVYKENQENYRSQLARTASTADAEGKAGVTALQKQADTYQQFVSTRDSLKKSIDLARNGSELANSVAGLQTTLFITTSEGVKRINETELQQVTGSGSAARQINAKLDKLGTGQIPESLRKEMDQLVDAYSAAKYQSYQNATKYTMQLHGLNPSNTPILSQDGTVQDNTPTNAAGLNPGASSYLTGLGVKH